MSSSSPLCCAEMALGRLPGFLPKSGLALVLERLSQMPRLVAVTPASRLEVRPAPEMVSIGIRDLDSLTGGLPRGCLTEICGPDSSGRTSVLLAALAAATRRRFRLLPGFAFVLWLSIRSRCCLGFRQVCFSRASRPCCWKLRLRPSGVTPWGSFSPSGCRFEHFHPRLLLKD